LDTASLAVSEQRVPADQTVDTVAQDMIANLLPGVFLLPAAVYEIGRLPDSGYRLFYL
jgi:hypothetical protein